MVDFGRRYIYGTRGLVIHGSLKREKGGLFFKKEFGRALCCFVLFCLVLLFFISECF